MAFLIVKALRVSEINSLIDTYLWRKWPRDRLAIKYPGESIVQSSKIPCLLKFNVSLNNPNKRRFCFNTNKSVPVVPVSLEA